MSSSVVIRAGREKSRSKKTRASSGDACKCEEKPAKKRTQKPQDPPRIIARKLSVKTGLLVTHELYLRDDDDIDGESAGHLYRARFDEDPRVQDLWEHKDMFLDDRKAIPLELQLIDELRRVSAIYSDLADELQFPKKAPLLTYAIVRVPDGRILERGLSRADADRVAWICNADNFWRAAVIPDADLRAEQPGHLEVDIPAMEKVWPTFPVGVFNNEGQVERILELKDPRLAFCRTFNRKPESERNGYHMWPLIQFSEDLATEEGIESEVLP